MPISPKDKTGDSKELKLITTANKAGAFMVIIVILLVTLWKEFVRVCYFLTFAWVVWEGGWMRKRERRKEKGKELLLAFLVKI